MNVTYFSSKKIELTLGELSVSCCETNLVEAIFYPSVEEKPIDQKFLFFVHVLLTYRFGNLNVAFYFSLNNNSHLTDFRSEGILDLEGPSNET